jgi:glycosyltransferase involved in cell wall biosynthesis
MVISIALCSFNGANYLSDQLKSIKYQTRQPDEIVVCDDCSSDETLKILHAFREECSFSVRIHSNVSRLGSIKNFEKAIELCKGDIIVLSDQDDVWVPEKLAIIEDAFEKHPGVGYTFSDANLANEEGLFLGQSLWNALGFNKALIGRFRDGEQLKCLFRKPIVTGATMAIRGSLKQFIMPFPESTIFVHDQWIALVASAINMYGLPLTDKLIMYRLHSAQEVGIRFPSVVALYKDFAEFDRNCFKEFVKAFECLISRLWHLHDAYNTEVTESVDQIKRKIMHLDNRFAIHSAKQMSSYKLVIREICSGGYNNYSDSWKSIVRDLLAKHSA